jgi:hypothetical protein
VAPIDGTDLLVGWQPTCGTKALAKSALVDGRRGVDVRLQVALVEDLERIGVVDLLEANNVGLRLVERQSRQLPLVVARHRFGDAARELELVGVIEPIEADMVLAAMVSA